MSGPFPTPVTTVPPAPVSHLPDGRLNVLDILRGLAIAGMILVHWHLGLRLAPAAYLLGAALLFTAQALASRAWLERHRMGPVE